MSVSNSPMLVTGAGGFVGHHVLAAVEEGVFGSTQSVVAPSGWNIRNPESVRELVEQVRPGSVLHLAAQSFVPSSFEDPAGTLSTNVIGTANLLHALIESGFQGRLLYVSSGDIYGAVADVDLPVDEKTSPHPRSPYAVSKWSAEQLCLQAQRIGKLDCVIARPFNHIGPGQGDQFVLPSIAKQIIEIERGERQPVIDVGDIDSTRDFTDVRDVVRAYAAMLRSGKSGSVYVVASGVERKVRDLLNAMLALTGLDATIRQDPARLRPSEQRRMVANAALLSEDTGWRPAIDINTTLSDILDFTRNRK